MTDLLQVFVDGGIRSGQDALKAVALGATGVFIGRPILWALSVEVQFFSSFPMNYNKLINSGRLWSEVSLEYNAARVHRRHETCWLPIHQGIAGGQESRCTRE